MLQGEGAKLELIELEKIYRQKDASFVELLGRIRNNSVEPEDIEHLNSRYLDGEVPEIDEFYINLTTTNKKADEVNEEHLEQLSERMHVSEADISGEITKEYFPTATLLNFKVGAQIMLLNNDQRKRWVNGTIGRD